jgi:hypothetical protein
MMNREREDALLRITAQYTHEARAGQHPKLGDYLARYPHYADEIADFVAYFHAFEEDMAVGGTIEAATEASIEDATFPQLLEEFHIAAEAAIDHIMREQESINVAEKVRSRKEPIANLQRVAETQENYQMP